MANPTVSRRNFIQSILAADLPAAAVTLTGTQTLTNKTLTTPIISTISNTGVVTLPTASTTLVGRDTTDTLTNKTLTSPALTTPTISNLTTAGDMLYGTGSGAIARIAVSGTAFQELTMNSGATAPVWVSGVTKALTTTGDIPYASGANAVTRLAAVATGNVLHSGGVGAAPTWSSVATTDIATGGVSQLISGSTIVADVTATTASAVDAGVTISYTAAGEGRVLVLVAGLMANDSGSTHRASLELWSGVVGSGTRLAYADGSGIMSTHTFFYVETLTGTHTLRIGVNNPAATGTSRLYAYSLSWGLVELKR